MQVKTFYASSAKKLDQQVNGFLAGGDVELVDVRFAASVFAFSAMVLYRPAAG